MVTTLPPEGAQRSYAASDQSQWIDVRDHAEFSSGHVPRARPLPLGELPSRLAELGLDRPIIIACRSGGRAARAAEVLERAGAREVVVIAGGTDAWRRAGLPLEREPGAPMSLNRQVQITAGALVVAGLFIPPWPYLSALVGVGLTFAGLTDTCGMAVVLSRMPWNRPRPPARR